MPAYVEICWRPTFIWKGKEYKLEKRCIRIPLYVEIIKIPVPVPVPPWTFEHEYLRQFEGAPIGPGLRDLGRSIDLLRIVDGIEDPDLRAPLQEILAASVHGLAAETLPGAEVDISFDRSRSDRAESA